MPAHSYRKAGICVFMFKVHLGSQDNFIKLIHLFRYFSIKCVHVLFFLRWMSSAKPLKSCSILNLYWMTFQSGDLWDI